MIYKEYLKNIIGKRGRLRLDGFFWLNVQNNSGNIVVKEVHEDFVIITDENIHSTKPLPSDLVIPLTMLMIEM